MKKAKEIKHKAKAAKTAEIAKGKSLAQGAKGDIFDAEAEAGLEKHERDMD
jgi:hypothetical protein